MDINRTLFLFLTTMCAFITLSCNKEQEGDKINAASTLSVGFQNSPSMALLMVAQEKNFFVSRGVNVEMKEFTAGKFALQAFLGGSLDIAISGEVPVALSILQGNQFKVIGQVVERTVNECRVVARKEGTITEAKLYFSKKGRKLATSFGGGPEFFTYNFFNKISIKESEIEIISQKPEDMPATLLSGSVDAIAIFDPFAKIAELQLGNKGITFTLDDIYSELYVIDVKQKTIDEKRELLSSFLKGLYDAQLFIADNPVESKKILMKYTKLDKIIIDEIWGDFVFKLCINQLFLDYTSAEAKWSISKENGTKNRNIPNYRDILYTDLLKEVDSSLVKIK